MPTILVIDDQATNRQVLSRLAAQADETAVVHSFADPREALEWVMENTPDLVVTDYLMPKATGIGIIPAVYLPCFQGVSVTVGEPNERHFS